MVIRMLDMLRNLLATDKGNPERSKFSLGEGTGGYHFSSQYGRVMRLCDATASFQ